MALSLTLGAITLRTQRRIDRENDDTIGTAEWQSLISEVYGDLHSVVARSGLRYFETTTTITSTGVAGYTQPADHLSTLLVSRIPDATGRRRDLDEIMPQEREHWSGLTGEAYAYAFIGGQIVFYPTPPTGQQYELVYVPQPADLSSAAPSTAVDVVVAAGLTLLTWGAAALALPKFDEDPGFAQSRADVARGELAAWAEERSMLQPRRIVRGEASDRHGSREWYGDADWRNR